MARYIKANPRVAAYLNLQNDRLAVNDGNYILWQADMLAFGPLTRLPETLAEIGAVALMPHEAREEQDGVLLRPLPTATDPRFVVSVSAPVETPEPETPANPVEEPGTDETEQPTEGEWPGENENPDETDNKAAEPGIETVK